MTTTTFDPDLYVGLVHVTTVAAEVIAALPGSARIVAYGAFA